MKKQRTKTIITTVVLLLALSQGPFLFYYTHGFFKLIFLPLIGIVGLGLTVYLFLGVWRHHSTNTIYHITGLILAFVIGFFTIRTDTLEYLDWKLRQADRDKIVEEVKEGVLVPDDNGTYHLASNTLLPISNGGNDIVINESENGATSVEFYIDRGVVDHYSALLYTDDKNEIAGLDRAIAAGSNRAFKKFSDNWYRVGY
ncbi:MAG: hypothetical protein ABI203_00920 [Mucilaginibacter sp.]